MSYHPGFDEAPATDVPVVVTEHFDYGNPKTVDEELKRLSLLKKFLLNWRGQVSVGLHQPEGWRAPMKFFLYHCENCGPILTYPHGHEGTIACRNCFLKQMRKR